MRLRHRNKRRHTSGGLGPHPVGTLKPNRFNALRRYVTWGQGCSQRGPTAVVSWLKLVIGPLAGGRGLVGVAMPVCCVERGKPWQRCSKLFQNESGWEVSSTVSQILGVHGTLGNAAHRGCGRARGDGAGRMMRAQAVLQATA